MIKRNWKTAAALVLSILTLIGYRVYDGLRTDTAAPRINLGADVLEMSVLDGEEVLLRGVTATDDRDGDVTASLVVEGISNINEAHEVTVTYAAFDRSGNVAKARRTVRYTDYESPRFTLSRPMLYSTGTSFDVMAAIRAEDVVDGDISHRIRGTSMDEASVTAVGIHSVLFRVTNSLGDTVELTLPVEVTTERFNAQLTLSEYLVRVKVGESFDYAEYLDTFTIRDETMQLHGRLPSGMIVRAMGWVDTKTPGVYSLMMTLTKQQGNQIYTGGTQLVVVVEE